MVATLSVLVDVILYELSSSVFLVSDLLNFIHKARLKTNDDIVIYTGYNEDEIEGQLRILSLYENIYIKFGRYIPNQQSHYDEVLGVNLASNNQYGKKVS